MCNIMHVCGAGDWRAQIEAEAAQVAARRHPFRYCGEGREQIKGES